MSVTSIFEYCQRSSTLLLLEYFYKGEKIDDPELFFDLNPGLFKAAFPSEQETLDMINKNVLKSTTHKLVVSEYGFNIVFL